MIRFLRFGQWVVFSLGSALAVAGPTDPYHLARPAYRAEGVDAGLPGSTVYALLLDRRQQLWVGTQDGVAMRSGQGWAQVPLPAGAPSRFVRALLESADGSLWVGTEAGGLWQRREGRWVHYDAPLLPSRRVNGLLETLDSDGRPVLWVATGGGGIARFQSGAWSRFGMESGLGDLWVWRLRQLRDLDGRPTLWAAGRGGLRVLRGGRWECPDPAHPDMFLGANGVAELDFGGGRREIWVSRWGRGLLRWDGRSWQEFGPGSGFPSLNPTDLSAGTDAQGHPMLWIGTYERGLVYRSGERFEHLGPGRFPQSGAYCMLPNPAGKPTVWVGTQDGGVISLDLGGWRSLDTRSGLPSDKIGCVQEVEGAAGQREIWIGTSNGALRWGASGAERPSLPNTLLNAVIRSGADGGSALWLATMNGLYRQAGAGWRSIPLPGGKGSDQAVCFAETRGSGGAPTLWIGTENHGLYGLNRAGWVHHTGSTGLPHDWVYALAAVGESDGQDSLWVGTRGGGVARLCRGQWELRNSGLPNLSIYHLKLTTGRDGRRWLWAATAGGGLARLELDRPGATWRSFDQQSLPGLPSDFLLRLELDRQGRLYVATPRGIARMRLEESPEGPLPGSVENFATGDGLPSSTAVFGASLVDSQGRVWVGTEGGMAVMDPGLESPAGLPPPPFLSGLSVNGRERPLSPGQVFSHREHRLQFQFAWGIHHRREHCRFQTQLLGLEAAPGPVQAEWGQTYAALPAGAYTLRFWGIDAQGRSSAPVDFPFRVAPSPWSGPWAWALYLLAGTGFTWAIHRVRSRWLLQRNRVLESLVRQRTGELEAERRRFEEQSLTDALTGLRNRRYVEARVLEDIGRIERSARSQGPGEVPSHLLVLMVDLDHFKSVNDTHGHAAGDRVLLETAEVLRRVVRSGDTAARWGGEEFLVIARDTPPEEGVHLAERIRAEVEAHPFVIPEGGVTLRRTCSVGFACFPAFPGHSGTLAWEQVLALADACLYEAKSSGRNRWVGLLPAPGSPSALDGPVTLDRLVAAGLGRLVRA